MHLQFKVLGAIPKLIDLIVTITTAIACIFACQVA